MAKKEAEASKEAAVQEGTAAVKNEKAEKFQKFLADNKINVFETEQLTDDFQTVVFRSRIETKGQILPMAVIIDNSVFTIIRTQIVAGLPSEKQVQITASLNELNEKYKIFKYYLRQDGVVYLDVCLPFVDESFDSNMIQLMLNVLVQHLNDTYSDIMEGVWAKNK